MWKNIYKKQATKVIRLPNRGLNNNGEGFLFIFSGQDFSVGPPQLGDVAVEVRGH